MPHPDPDDWHVQNEVAERLIAYAARLRAEQQAANDQVPAALELPEPLRQPPRLTAHPNPDH